MNSVREAVIKLGLEAEVKERDELRRTSGLFNHGAGELERLYHLKNQNHYYDETVYSVRVNPLVRISKLASLAPISAFDASLSTILFILWTTARWSFCNPP